tara:strand:+ start:253 stop:594 length:342 start_codon:yes stop_codon:yes gene_type:complete
MILGPLHWAFFDNKCIFTYISECLGDYDNKELDTDASFTESNFKWLLHPIMNIFGMEWDSKNVHKMLILYSLINITLVWFYAFYMCGDAKLPEPQLTSVVSQEPVVTQEPVLK